MAKQRVRVSYNPVAHLALVFICLSLTGVASSLGNFSVVIVLECCGFFLGQMEHLYICTECQDVSSK